MGNVHRSVPLMLSSTRIHLCIYVCTYEYMEVVRHVVVNDMSCWTIVEHVYGIITLIINSSFHKLFNVQRFTHHGLHQVQK